MVIRSIFLLLSLLIGAASFAGETPVAESEPATSCPGFFRRLGSRISAEARIWTGTGTRRLDADSFAIFERIRLNPSVELSAAELAHLEAKGLSSLVERYRSTNEAVRQFNHLRALSLRSQAIPSPDRTRFQRFTNWFLETTFPGLPVAPQERVNRIFQRALDANNFTLSSADTEFLRKWSALEDFARFQRESEQLRQGFLVASRIHDTGNAVRWTVVGGVASATAVLPALETEVVAQNSPEGQSLLRAPERGQIQVYFPTDATKPAIIRFGNAAIAFNMLKVEALQGARITALQNQINQDGAGYNRVDLAVTNEEMRNLRAAALQYVSRRQTNAQGEQEYSQRQYYDFPSAEVFRLLRNHLQMPPAPIVNRDTSLQLTYFSVLRAMQGSEPGRIRRVVSIRSEAEASQNEVVAAGRRALGVYFQAIGLGTMAGAVGTVPMLIYDSQTDTRRETNIVLPPATAPAPATAAEPSAPPPPASP